MTMPTEMITTYQVFQDDELEGSFDNVEAALRCIKWCQHFGPAKLYRVDSTLTEIELSE